ncbi:MAG TPA: hypothetical protein VFY88_11080 [Intrasporangium sp.]|nr:hypothetical protein [Intrasporangium sp.]
MVAFTVAGLLLVACGEQSRSPDAATSPGGAGGRETTAVQTVPTVEATTPPTVDPREPTTVLTTGTSEPSTPSREATTARVLKPKLTFTDRTVQFERPFRLRLRATTRPSAPVVYRVVADDPRDSSSGKCRVEGDRLTLEDVPSLSAACVVEARVPPASGVVAPPPVRAVITITPPPVQISVPERVVSWAADASAGAARIHIRENSGDAYGMGVTSNSSQCTIPEDAVSPGYPARAGINEYVATVEVQDPQNAEYQCELVATPLPQDIFHDVEGFAFTITVRP